MFGPFWMRLGSVKTQEKCVLGSVSGCVLGPGPGPIGKGPRPKPGRGQDGSKMDRRTGPGRIQNGSPNGHETHPKRICKRTCIPNGLPNAFPYAFNAFLGYAQHPSVSTTRCSQLYVLLMGYRMYVCMYVCANCKALKPTCIAASTNLDSLKSRSSNPRLFA